MFQIGPKEIGADLGFGVDLALFIVQYTNTATPTSEKITPVMARIILRSSTKEDTQNKDIVKQDGSLS